MALSSTFFYNQTINIFTDASCISLKPAKYNNVDATSPGFIATYGGRIITTGMEIYLGENSMYGEAKAIEIAVNWCIYAASKGIYVTKGYSIFSDNYSVIQYMCNTLIQWFDILQRQDEKGLLPRNKMTSLNWEANAFNAAFSIFTSGLPIRIFHVKGHVNLRPFSHIKQKDTFLRLNEPYHGNLVDEIDIPILHDQATFNNMVDMMTRNFLINNQQRIESDIDQTEGMIDFSENKIIPIRWPFSIKTVPEKFKMYSSLLLSQNQN